MTPKFAFLCFLACCIGSPALAVSIPPPGTADPLELSACFAKQSQDECALLDLQGAVKRVVVLFQRPNEKYYVEYLLDEGGQIQEIRKYPSGNAGSPTTRSYFYDAQGRVVYVLLNGKASEEYTYDGPYLSSAVRNGKPVTYAVEVTALGYTVKATAAEVQTTSNFDIRGRLTYAADNYGVVISKTTLNTGAQCSFQEGADEPLSVTCVVGAKESLTRGYDETGRLLTDGGYTFVYSDDSRGNWISAEVTPQNKNIQKFRAIEYR